MSAAREFRAFILRGNVVDLAIAVVIGAAFGAVVASLVADIVTPLIAAIFGKPSFDSLHFTINHSTFLYGHFLNAVFTFLVVAAVLFFFVVKPLNMLLARRKTELPVDPSTRDCPYCLSSVPLAATRCAFCTSELSAGSQPARV